MAFGVMVGWGAFAMPGNTFLPVAGPAGTLISMLIGMAIMQAHIAKPIDLSVLTKTLLSILKL